MRTIIIGDVHGCRSALDALLTKTEPKPESDRLVFLGDLFDRGPDSYEVFEIVKALGKEFGERFVLLRGNHEDYLLQEKLTISQRLIWERVGRGATVKSFREHGSRMEGAIPWFKEHCTLFFRDESIQCVHAGLMVDPVEVNDTQTMIHDHGIVLKNAYTGRLTAVGHIALKKPSWFAGDGETIEELPHRAWMALPEKGIICIDTGCGKNGYLTGMVVEGGKFFLESADEL